MDSTIKKMIDYTEKGYSITVRPDHRNNIEISVEKENHRISHKISKQELEMSTVGFSIFDLIDGLISNFEHQMSM